MTSSDRQGARWSAGRRHHGRRRTQVGPADLTREGFARLLSEDAAGQEVGLVIRTTGEQRLSDFPPWESAYAGQCFLNRLWPDVQAADLAAAVADFAARDRRFGGLPAACAEA